MLCYTIILARLLMGFLLGAPWDGMLDFVDCFGHIVRH